MRETVNSIHHKISAAYPKPYSFDPKKPLDLQQKAIRKRYIELLHMTENRMHGVPNIVFEKKDNPFYNEIRFEVETEPGFFVPAHMLIPKELKSGEKLPAVICLQGHSTGMHISLGRKKFPNDSCDGDRDFAIQAVSRGYIAIAVEQRGMGELSSTIKNDGPMCYQVVLEALMCGRTIQGERINDIMCMVDALEQFDCVDADRIAIMGNSGGGTTSYHAAALEPRIKVVMPCCSFCTYEDSILSMFHCSCNYVPGISAEMEMPDLAMLIAPRPLIIINGERDPIFPLEAANRAFETVKKIYIAAGKPDNCRHIIGDGEHRFYADDSWPIFERYI